MEKNPISMPDELNVERLDPLRSRPKSEKKDLILVPDESDTEILEPLRLRPELEKKDLISMPDESDVEILPTSVSANPITISSESSDDSELPNFDFNMSNDSSQTFTKSRNVELHNNKIPIYSRPNKNLAAMEIFKLCLGELSDEYICKSKPVSVRYNSVFIVDLQVVDMKSLYADDNGVWKVSTPRSYFQLQLQDGKVENVVPANKFSYSHFIKRQYGTHQATLIQKAITFQRIISSVVSKDGKRSRYCVVQYIHRDGSEDDVIVEPHGNFRHSKRPFYKTDPHVLQSIKEEPLQSKPRRVFKNLVDDAGGPLFSSSASSEPRNLQQIYNVKRSQDAAKRTDDFMHLISQVKEDSFVHDLTIDSNSIQYVLISEKQLNDMNNCCTHPFTFSVLSLDSTYDVGNYFVTNTCFENLKVVHADGKYRGRHPLEMGPTFVHTNKDTHAFVGFFSSILRMKPDLKTIQAIGSDGDEAIMNASLICFQDSLKVLCSNHKKENIERKLKGDYRAREAASNHLLSDIFGKDCGPIYEKGLIDCTSTFDFDKKNLWI